MIIQSESNLKNILNELGKVDGTVCRSKGIIIADSVRIRISVSRCCANSVRCPGVGIEPGAKNFLIHFSV